MKRNFICTLIACLLLTTCSSEEEWNLSDHTPAVELGEEQVAVQLNLQATDFTIEGTRSTTPVDLQIENPMYNLWSLHYNEERGLVESDTKYTHLNDKEELATNYTATLALTDGNQGILRLVVNPEGVGSDNSPSTAYTPSNDNGSWPKTLQLLQKELLTLSIDRNATDATLGLPSRMFIYGFYQDTLNTSHPVNIMLGHAAARLDIIIKAVDSEITLCGLQLQLRSAVIKSHYSPMKIDSEEDIYIDSPLDNTLKNETMTNSVPVTCYYFTGEDIASGIEKETVLIVKTGKITAEIKEIDVIVKCNKGNTGTRQCEYQESPNYNNQRGGFINYDTRIYYCTTGDGSWFLGHTYNYAYYKKEKRTVKVESSEETVPCTYITKLGANAPGTSDDYSPYRNNNYAFNINSK